MSRAFTAFELDSVEATAASWASADPMASARRPSEGRMLGDDA